jgi:glycosyltransferase involved in cell wall biosynthesis
MTRKLALVIHALDQGGAQRAFACLANYWARAEHEVTVVTLAERSTDVFELDPKVNRVALGLVGDSGNAWQALVNNRRRIRAIRTALHDSGARQIISFVDQTNILTLIAARPLRIPVVVAERTDPRHHRIGRVWSVLRRFHYRRAAAVVVQTESVQQWVSTWSGCSIVIIPNAIDAPMEHLPQPVDQESSKRRVIAAMGRLSREKGFDILINVFAALQECHPDWNLRIIGDGPQRQPLSEQAKRLASDRVQFSGWVADPAEILGRCHLFVLPSQYEGFPNALLEAMAAGLPVVSFDCDSGPSDIVRHDVDGLLVSAGDAALLQAAMDRCMSDDPLRKRLGKRAREVVDRFSREATMARWDELLERADQPIGTRDAVE